MEKLQDLTPEAQEAALQIVLQDDKIRLKIPSQTDHAL